jgi:hypothetical protein
MISPTGLWIRSDRLGDGHFGARRDGGRRNHAGTDFECAPGNPVFAPIAGRIVREARPYSDGDYSGLLIQNSQISIKMFYFEPDTSLIGTFVTEGAVIGTAQDISKRYGKAMTPHIHLQIESIDPELLIERK